MSNYKEAILERIGWDANLKPFLYKKLPSNRWLVGYARKFECRSFWIVDSYRHGTGYVLQPFS